MGCVIIVIIVIRCNYLVTYPEHRRQQPLFSPSLSQSFLFPFPFPSLCSIAFCFPQTLPTQLYAPKNQEFERDWSWRPWPLISDLAADSAASYLNMSSQRYERVRRPLFLQDGYLSHATFKLTQEPFRYQKAIMTNLQIPLDRSGRTQFRPRHRRPFDRALPHQHHGTSFLKTQSPQMQTER